MPVTEKSAGARGTPRYTSAIVTGASSGIGAAFARALAREGTHLVLVARRAERLQSLARELSRSHGVDVEPLPLDLSRAEASSSLAARIEARPPDLLVNNAGFARYGAFTDLPLGPQLELVDVNVRALVELSHAFVRGARARGRGALVQVASTAGYVPVPYEAVYAASKCFVLHFGEALWEELRGTGVRVLTLCPGFTETEFAGVAGLPPKVVLQHGITPEAVVETALAALQRGSPTVVHGQGTKLAGALGRVAPRRLVLRLVGAWMRRGLP
jgi:hypothetical protein